MEIFIYLVVAAGAFLLGSIPTGYLVARSRGMDIRQHGSGNIGATNIFRTLGKPLGIFVFFADALKGAMAVELAFTLGGEQNQEAAWLGIIAAVAVIGGHNYTPWLGFRGGKGIATSAGVLLALMPLAVAIIATVWGVVFFTTRYVSLASISAAAALPLSLVLLWGTKYGSSPPLLGFAVVISGLAIWRHRTNIERLRAGTESRFDRKTKS
jgi:glycerol-3-phosphate acyltransferase PlsY